MTPTEIAALLRKARAKIEQPECWTKGANARDKQGRRIDSEKSPKAACWCANGAIFWAAPDKREAHQLLRILQLHASVTTLLYVHSFNDDPTTTHADILALFDRAIAAQEAANAL